MVCCQCYYLRLTLQHMHVQEQAGLQSDYEFLTTYTRLSADHVTARQREVYYGPADGLAGGLAHPDM